MKYPVQLHEYIFNMNIYKETFMVFYLDKEEQTNERTWYDVNHVDQRLNQQTLRLQK